MIWPPLTARNVATLTVSQASEADRRGSAWGSELSGTVHIELETGSRRISITVAAGTSIVCPLLAAVSARRPSTGVGGGGGDGDGLGGGAECRGTEAEPAAPVGPVCGPRG